MAKRLRNISIHLRLSAPEYERIKERMEFCKIVSISDYIRHMSVDGCIMVVDHSDIRKYNYELNRIGNNINQIAHHVNGTGTVLESEIKELQEMMTTIWQLQKSSQFIQL